jgi:hypothetical protein
LEAVLEALFGGDEEVPTLGGVGQSTNTRIRSSR